MRPGKITWPAETFSASLAHRSVFHVGLNIELGWMGGLPRDPDHVVEPLGSVTLGRSVFRVGLCVFSAILAQFWRC